MGNLSSKSTEVIITKNAKSEMERYEGDPRSPTIDIDRTPLQTSRGFNKAVTKNVDLTKQCFENCETAMNPQVKTLMSQIDPRSPTLDFQRTPLAFMLKHPELILAHNHLNTTNFLNDSGIPRDEHDTSNTGIITELEPKNLCEELGNLSVNDNSAIVEDIEGVPEDQKDADECEIIINEHIEQENSSKSVPEIRVIGLLETNLDFIETDLDTVRRRKKTVKSIKPKDDNVADTIDIGNEKDSDPPLLSELEKIDISDRDPRSPTVGIDRTPILVPGNKKNDSELSSTNNKMNSQLREVFMNNMKLSQKKRDKVKKTISESLLIYEDITSEQIPVVSSKTNSNIQNNEGNRTPLACMMNIENVHQNSTNNTPNENVYDLSKKISNSTKSINISKSKIPVRVSRISPSEIKSFKTRRVVNLDSENTPPQPRKACWDQENSVIL